jgi:hypothetical protein
MKNVPWIACALIGLALFGCQSTGSGGAAADTAATAAPAPAGEEEYKNTLKWTTASEVNNFGYYIYRSTSEEGPFERITEDPIPGAGTTDEPTPYVYEDDTIDPTQGYYYYIESISMNGVYEKFSPVTYIKPKAPIEE